MGFPLEGPKTSPLPQQVKFFTVLRYYIREEEEIAMLFYPLAWVLVSCQIFFWFFTCG